MLSVVGFGLKDSCNELLKIQFAQLHTNLSRELLVVTTQELEDRYPELKTGSERESAFLKEHQDKAVFLMQIGGKLRSGEIHDGRAPDYDDWSLNGDIVVYYPLLDMAYELSSMGIRVNAVAPGYIDTKMNAHLSEDEKKALCEEIPLGRAGTPAEVAAGVRFLAESPYITGETLVISGGWR